MRWSKVSHHLSMAEFRRGLGWRIAFVLLHQTDMLLTSFAVSTGFRELNPLIRGLLESPAQLLVVKLVIPLFIAWMVPAKFLIPAIIFLLVVLGLNLRELSSLL